MATLYIDTEDKVMKCTLDEVDNADTLVCIGGIVENTIEYKEFNRWCIAQAKGVISDDMPTVHY
jgi:hypothetical protein